MSSDMVPWMSEYEISDLPDYEAICAVLGRCGKKAIENGMRLSYHPGPFNVLATSNQQVLTKTIKELRQHAEIMDMMQIPATPFSKIIYMSAAPMAIRRQHWPGSLKIMYACR